MRLVMKFGGTAINSADKVRHIASLIKSQKEKGNNEIVRKAIMFWTRNPKITNRIWISVIKDDMLIYPKTVEEARSFLFDVNKIIELNVENLDSGVHKLFADVEVTWGKHTYTGPTVIAAKSNVIEVTCRK